MFPQMVLTTPLLSLVINLGLYNNLLSLVVVYCTFSLPYSIWMMRSYFNELPKDLEERRWWTAATASRPSSRSCCRWRCPA